MVTAGIGSALNRQRKSLVQAQACNNVGCWWIMTKEQEVTKKLLGKEGGHIAIEKTQ